MVTAVQDEFGIPPVLTLTILGAETSLGDPILGGDLIRSGSHNYGCLKYMGETTRWGVFSDGEINVRGVDWYTFPTPAVGVRAWAIYMKFGPASDPGYYLHAYPDWRKLAKVYYGEGVPGYEDYVTHLEQLANKFSTQIKAAGYDC